MLWFRAGVGSIAVLITLAGCAPPATTQEPYSATFTGSTASPWIAARAGWSDIEARQNPGGCASHIVFADGSEHVLVQLAPAEILNSPSAAAAGASASARWSGMSANLSGGAYRFEGQATTGCRWSVRVTLPSAH